MKKVSYVKSSSMSVTDALNQLTQAKELLSQAYDILDGEVADYVDSVIDYSLVDDLSELIRNIGDAIDGGK